MHDMGILKIMKTENRIHGEKANIKSIPPPSGGIESACNAETQVRSLGQEDPLEEGMAIHSSILAWRIPWTEEPGGLQSMGKQRVEHD